MGVWQFGVRRLLHDRPDHPPPSTGPQHPKGPGERRRHPHLREHEAPGDGTGAHPGPPEGRGPVGCGPPESLPHHLEERAHGIRWTVPRRTQLHRAAPSPHRRARPHHRPGGQVVPHRLPQGGGLLRLSGSPAGHRTVRRRVSPGGVALHRQLLPGRRVQLQAAGGPVGGHPPGGHEPGAVRVALPDRRGGDRHPRLRVQRQGDLRQDPRAAAGARLHDLQPV